MIGHFLYFIIFTVAVFLIALLPLRVMYLFGNVIYFFLRYLAGYRVAIARINLANSFPGKRAEEINKILNSFYRNLADISVEALKGFAISRRQVVKRYKILNPELLDKYFRSGQSLIGVAGHYANWEWGALVAGIFLKHKPIAFYKPLDNPFIDRLMKWTRDKKGTTMVSIADTAITFENTKSETCLYLLVADQSPVDLKKAFWVNFLNQDTPCLHGPEKYANLYNYPVIFIDIQRCKRGFYSVELSELCINPMELSHGEVTRRYMLKLEEVITKNPANWLWTHRRWKRKRPIYLAN